MSTLLPAGMGDGDGRRNQFEERVRMGGCILNREGSEIVHFYAQTVNSDHVSQL